MSSRSSRPEPSRRSELVELARSPVWRWWTLASLLGRLPAAMLLLALILVGQQATGSLADGALLVAVLAGAFAVAAPWRGRLLDRGGLRRALRRDCLVAAALTAGIAGAASVSAPLGVLALLAGALGVASSGIEGGFRALLDVVVAEERIGRANAVDAVMVESTFVVGPALAGGLALWFGPVGVLTGMSASLVGSGLIAHARLPGRPVGTTRGRRGARGHDEPSAGTHEPSAGAHEPSAGAHEPSTRASAGPDVDGGPDRGHRPWLPGPTVVYVLAVAAGATVGLLESALPARAETFGLAAAVAGPLLALTYAGSVGGGLLASLARDPVGRVAARAAGWFLLLGAAGIAAALATGPWQLALLLIAVGAPLAPLNALGAMLLQHGAPPERHGEAFTVYIAAQVAGASLGNAATSQLLPVVGPAALLGMAGAVAAVTGAVVGVVALRRPWRDRV